MAATILVPPFSRFSRFRITQTRASWHRGTISVSYLGSSASGSCCANSTSVQRTSQRMAALRNKAFSKAGAPGGDDCWFLLTLSDELATEERLLVCSEMIDSTALRGEYVTSPFVKRRPFIDGLAENMEAGVAGVCVRFAVISGDIAGGGNSWSLILESTLRFN